jgi:MarR family transcriptional regulator, organic hydroperoxide resistance regulator
MREKAKSRIRLDPSDAKHDYHESPFYNMARMIGLYHQKLDAALKPIGIDAPRWRVLCILQKHQSATVTQISVEAVTKMSTMAKIVQRMALQGLVVTRASAEDARSTEVRLTEKGLRMLEVSSKKVSIINRQVFSNISDSDVDLITLISRKAYANLAP